MPDRLRRSGRAGRMARGARAYLAGVGTSGSLLAGAALMFIVASALVAFRGWPHVASQPSPAEVVVAPRSASAATSPVARRLAFITGPGADVVPATGRAGRGLTGAGRGVGSGTRRSVGAPAATTRTGGGTAGPSAGGSTPAPSPTPGSSVTEPAQQAVHQDVGTLGNVVGGIGNSLGSTVQKSTGAVGGTVGTVSPSAGGAVTSTGSGAAKAIKDATKTLTGVLSGLSR